MLQANNVIENTPDNVDVDLYKMDQIRSNLNEIKISVEDVNQKLNNLDKNKKNLDQQKIIEENRHIDEKKLEIEKKKKETELLIKQLRDLTELEQDVSVTANVKTELDQYEKQLKDIKLQSPGFWNKMKESSNKAIGWVRENPWQAAGVATWVGLLVWWISRLFKKRKEKKESKDWEDKEKTPWYKKWYTWAWVGLAWFLGWRYRWDIKNLWNSLFNWEKDQKDKFGKELVESLGKDRSYDSAWNIFTYKSKKYTWENFYEQKLIHTQMNVDGKLVLDIDKSVKAIKEYVEKDTDTLPDKHNLVDFEKYRNDWNILSEVEKQKYLKLDDQIGGFYKDLNRNDYLWFGSNTYGLDKWFLLFHFDQSFDNIWTLLNENTFNLFMNSTTKSSIESIFRYFPDFIISSFLSVAKGMNILWLEQIAQDTSRLGEYLKSLKPTEITKLKELCLYFYNQATSIAYYAHTVRESYIDQNWDDINKIEEFDKKKLKDLDLDSATDQKLVSCVQNVKVDKDLWKKVEKLDSRQNKLIDKLDKTTTTQQQREVIEELIDEIDDVGYHTWNSAFALIWWHLWETNDYIDYDIISKMNKDQFAVIRWELNELLKKDPLTDTDKQKIKDHIQDFYSTMKLVSTQTKLRQKTDEDWNLFTVWQFPIVKWWKTIYQTFMLYMEEDKRVLAWWTVLAAALVWDMLTWPARKVLAMRKLLRWKAPIVRLSPTDWAVRKITNWTFAMFWWGTKMALREPTRVMNQTLNRSKLYRSMTFRNPESLLEAVNKWHIRLKDAATMLAGKSSWKTLVGFKIESWGKNWTTLGFSSDIDLNTMKLLEKNDWIRNNIGSYDATNNVIKKQYETLAKYRDTKYIRIARRSGFEKDKLVRLLTNLSDGNLAAATSTLKNSKINNLVSTTEELSGKILESKNNIEKITKETFESFEQKLAQEAKIKKFVVWSDDYNKLSKEIWETTDSYWPKLQKIVAENNEVIMKAEENIMRQFNKASWSQKQHIYASDDIVKNIVRENWWIEKWKIPGFGKTGRLISVWIHAVMLGWVSSSPDEKGNEKDRSTIGWEAADFGLGMIPVAGGIYDIGMAFRGKDLNGREMWTAERWIRWWVGLWTWALDVFTFWLWWTAIRGVLKWGTKLAVSAWTKTVVKEAVGVASKWIGTWVAKQILKSSVRNIIIWTAAWIALIPVAGGIREVFIDDWADEEAKEDKDILDYNTDVLDNSSIE